MSGLTPCHMHKQFEFSTVQDKKNLSNGSVTITPTFLGLIDGNDF